MMQELNEACKKGIPFIIQQKLGSQMLNALLYGVAISEVVWQRKDKLWVPVDFIPIPRKSFRFERLDDGTVAPVLEGGEPLTEPYKFIIHRNDRGTGSPSGVSILKSVYWPWKFKKLGFKFWVMAAERIGVPSILAIFETKNEDVAKERAGILADILQNVRSGSSLALGNVKDVKYLNAEGALKDFDVLVKVCNTEISYGLTGQSLTTNEAQYGTRANAVLHDETFAAVISRDAQNLQASMQALYNWFTEINYPGTEALAFEIDAGEFAPWETVTKAIELGVPVSKKALYSRHKIPKPEDESDTFVSTAMQGGSESEEFADRGKGNSFFF